LELARWALMQPARQETTYEEYSHGHSVELHAQCNSCGNPCAIEDNFCSCCGRPFKKERA
jgi:predicted amidophosphoribosyltransferase